MQNKRFDFMLAVLVMIGCFFIAIITFEYYHSKTLAEKPVFTVTTEAAVPMKSEDIIPVLESVKPEENSNPYKNLNLTFHEKELLAQMVYAEARGESFDGQIAVVQVALNRYLHGAYGNSISEVLFAPHQFSVSNTYTQQQLSAVEEALSGNLVLEQYAKKEARSDEPVTDVFYFSTGSLSYGSYYCTIGNHVFRAYV